MSIDLSIIDDAMKMKKKMLLKGIWVAKAKCTKPDCGGFLFATIAKRNKHIHVACNGSCGRNLME